MATTMMRSTAIAALLALPLASAPAFGQEARQAQSTTPANPEATGGQKAAQADGMEQPDALLATVGEADIRGSDVMSVIAMLPPGLRSQGPEMLVPLALDQLILRELILEEARAQNLAEDPEVARLSEGAAQGAEEDAMVQVWIDRELAGAVTDEAVRQVHDRLRPQDGQAVPPLEQLRPQIEQHLRQQAMQEIRDRLRQDAEVTFYDPSGQPVREAQDGDAEAITGTQNTASDARDRAAASGQKEPEMQGDAQPAAEPPLVGGWVGVQIQDVTPQIARALGLPEAGGALVAAVEPGSPAAEAGIAPGSVITAVGDARVERALDLAGAISEHDEGDEVTLTLRSGPRDTEEVVVTIGNRPSLNEVEGDAVQDDDARPRLGVAVAPLSPEVRDQMGLPADLEGLVVSRVEEGSAAEDAEIAEGDVIVAADRTPVTGVDALREAAATAQKEQRPLLLRVFKDGAYSYIPVEPGPA